MIYINPHVQGARRALDALALVPIPACCGAMTFHLGLGRNPPTRIHEDPIFWPHWMRLPSVNEPGLFSRAASMPAAEHVGDGW
jgi:hypothetical protein